MLGTRNIVMRLRQAPSNESLSLIKIKHLFTTQNKLKIMYLSGALLAALLFTVLRCMPNFNEFIKDFTHRALDYDKKKENVDEHDLQLDDKELDLLKELLSNDDNKVTKKYVNILHLFATLFSWIGVFFIILGFIEYKKFNNKNI